jgi:hypothetical protein
MIIPALQLLPGWTQQATPDITPHPPASFGYLQPSARGGMVFYCTGQKGEYCGWLSAQHLPLPADLPAVFPVSFDLSVIFNEQALKSGQAFEFDFLHCQNGWNYLLGTQVLLNQGNALNVSNNSGGWQAPAFPGPQVLAAGVPHRFTLYGVVDTVAHAYTRGPIIIDNVIYPPPANQSSLKATNAKWSDGIIPQIQMGTPNDGSSWNFELLDASVSAG